MSKRTGLLVVCAVIVVAALAAFFLTRGDKAALPETAAIGPSPTIPEPTKTLIPTVHIAPAKGWPEGAQPKAANDLAVTAFATGLYSSALALRTAQRRCPGRRNRRPAARRRQRASRACHEAGAEARRRRRAERQPHHAVARRRRRRRRETRTVFLEGLNSPFGMALVGNDLYVANADAISASPTTTGADARSARTASSVADLPGGPINHHWTKNLVASPDGIAALRRASAPTATSPKTASTRRRTAPPSWRSIAQPGEARIFASGLRNPNGMDWEPQTGALWTVVNERDELGNNLVPDYMTAVKTAAFYGWPLQLLRPARGHARPAAANPRWSPRRSFPITRSAPTPPRWG